MKATDRHKLIDRINTLEGLTDDERSALLGLLREHKTYGLVWEDKPEDVEEHLRNELPVLIEDKERALTDAGPDAPNHILIEGDNLEALATLAYTHAGKIDVIYIDPPYNTGNKDFIYNDSYVDSEDSYRHSKWLSFMSRRLRIAKKLLTEKGVIFISIDDNELSNLRLLCDEVFGFYNYEATITYVRKTSGKQDSSNFAKSTEYILIYSKSSNWTASSLPADDKVTDRYNKVDSDGRRYRETDLRKTGNADRKVDRPLMYYPFYLNPSDNTLLARQNSDPDLIAQGFIEIFPIKPDGTDGRWRWALSTANENLENLIAKEMPKYKGKYTVYEKDYIDKKEGERTVKEHTSWDRKAFNSDNAMMDFKELGFGNQDFPFPKSTDLIQHILFLANFPDGIYLDFFAGSGTTMQALLRQNNEDGGRRQCILCTNNENGICENVTYERNKRVIQGYTKPNGEEVAGLANNNLRYYRTDFVGLSRSTKNMRRLVQLSTDMLCIKENLYAELKTFAGLPTYKNIYRYFEHGDKKMLVIYDERYVDEIVKMISSVETTSKIKVYVFSPSEDPWEASFEPVSDKVELCALPQAIYNTYKRILPKRRQKPIELTEEEDALAGADEEEIGGLFSVEGGDE